MANCRMDITLLDPLTYTSIESHAMRQDILRHLFQNAYDEPITKQAMADALGIKYQQLVYQLNDHLSDFWEVKSDEKVRGARREYIGPRNPHAVYIALGREGKVFVVDPLAGRFGPLRDSGLRCDSCSKDEAAHCVASLTGKGVISGSIDEAEEAVLARNGRNPPFTPLDHGIIGTLQGLAKGEGCILVIPCERCTFLQRKNIIPVE